MAKAIIAKRKISKAASAPDQQQQFLTLDAKSAVQIVGCYGLLARATFDLGLKAEGSSKLSRVLEDVAQARDTLAKISNQLTSMAVGPAAEIASPQPA